MQNFGVGKTNIYRDRRSNLLYPVAFFWGVVFISVLAFIWYESAAGSSKTRYFLLPWCFLTGLSVILPNFYLWYTGRFNLFNPIVYAGWIYFFPAFFIGGLVLAAGYSEPFYLAFVQDERNDLPMTLIYVILGYLGLSVGFLLPFGKKIGEKVGDRLPVWDWEPNKVVLPALILLGVGFLTTALAFISGIIGYQRLDEIGAYDGLIYLTTQWGAEAAFLLWLVIFRANKLTVNHFLLIGFLIITAISKSAYQGNRGSLIFFTVMAVCAFAYSERKISLRHKTYGAILITMALVAGMIYGTTFRSIRQADDQEGIGVYSESIFNTLDRISEQDFTATLGTGFAALAERIESVSPLAVVVSNYEILAPYEESYGLDNNIWKDSVTFFIPRVIWNDKPVASEAYKYGDLYFNYSENAFVVTPMGDLLRNFGPVGVPVGMLLLGFLIRIIYASLVENRRFSFWRVTMFYMILMSISYESFYGTIVPFLMKVGFISMVGLFFINFFINKSKSASKGVSA